jgi:hypothetical protein
MKVSVEKVISSSIDPVISTIVNFSTFINSLKQAHNNALENNFFQSLHKISKSMGWSTTHCALNNIVILKKEHCKSTMPTLIIVRIHVCVDPNFLS